MWNIIIGIVFVVGGLSGQLALRGFDSPEGLAGFGGALIVGGSYRQYEQIMLNSLLTNRHSHASGKSV